MTFSLTRGGRTGNGVSTSGIIGTGAVTSGGMFGPPDEPRPRTAEQQRAYMRALEAERDEYRRAGDDEHVAMCEAELSKERAIEAERDRE